MIINLFFIFFSFILIFSAFMVIISQNSVHSILFLIMCFIMSAFLLFLLECEFMALIFILIYVGAISVLFLFVIMMLTNKQSYSNNFFLKYIPFGSFLGFVFVLEIFFLLNENFKNNPYLSSFLFNYYSNWFEKIDSFSEIDLIAQLMYTKFFVQFLLAGLILLIAVIGSVVLAKKIFIYNQKPQIIFKQLSRNYKNSLFFD